MAQKQNELHLKIVLYANLLILDILPSYLQPTCNDALRDIVKHMTCDRQYNASNLVNQELVVLFYQKYTPGLYYEFLLLRPAIPTLLYVLQIHFSKSIFLAYQYPYLTVISYFYELLLLQGYWRIIVRYSGHFLVLRALVFCQYHNT